jgi:hypothetical protein
MTHDADDAKSLTLATPPPEAPAGCPRPLFALYSSISLKRGELASFASSRQIPQCRQRKSMTQTAFSFASFCVMKSFCVMDWDDANLPETVLRQVCVMAGFAPDRRRPSLSQFDGLIENEETCTDIKRCARSLSPRHASYAIPPGSHGRDLFSVFCPARDGSHRRFGFAFWAYRFQTN